MNPGDVPLGGDPASLSADGVEVFEAAVPQSEALTRMGLAEALEGWVQLTGVEPRESGSFTMGEYNIQRLHKEIGESLDLDPTELTGRMLLSYIVQTYFQDRQFTVDELLNAPDRVAEYLRRSRELASFLRGPGVAGAADAFAERLTLALERYGAVGSEVRQIMGHAGSHGDRGFLAVLRRDAMRTLAHLQVNQFLDGEPEQPGFAPSYGRFIYRWDNINSMLRAMVGAPSGVTVNMIQSAKNPYGVYFVFAIRNGGRLFVFTDKEATPHPMAEGMWRRPDKILSSRAHRNWFPYELAGLKFNNEGKAYIDTACGRSIVGYQTVAQPVHAISDLPAPQVIWLTMMLDLIVDKFWRQEYRAAQLSYTGEMTRVATPLLEAAQAARLPLSVREDAVLSVAPVTLADVHSDAVREEDVGTLTDGRHDWLEARYKDQVLPESIDLIDASGETLFVRYDPSASNPPSNSKPVSASGSTTVAAARPIGDATIVSEAQATSGVSVFDRDEALAALAKLDSLDPTSFGTREEIERDRRFIARSNYAVQIDRLAQQEFSRRKDEVKAWVLGRVLQNNEFLASAVTAASRGDVRVKTACRQESGGDCAFGCHYGNDGTRTFIVRRDLDEGADKARGEIGLRKNLHYMVYGEGNFVLGQAPYKAGAPACHFTDAPSQWVVQIIPETAEQLAFMCGVQVPDLPDVLQHWTMLQGRSDNHILRRVDPMAWQLSDPWRALHFVTSVFVGKKAMKSLLAKSTESPLVIPASAGG